MKHGQAPVTKMRTRAYFFMLAAMRAIERVMPDDPGAIPGPLGAMGTLTLAAAGAERVAGHRRRVGSRQRGMKSRLDVSAMIVARVKNLINPSELLDTISVTQRLRKCDRPSREPSRVSRGLDCCSCHPNSSGVSDEPAWRTALSVTPQRPRIQRRAIRMGLSAEICTSGRRS